MTMIAGGCLCGRVRFQAEAKPVVARLCWCRDCQAFAAGNATVNVVFPADGFEIEGETRDYVSTADSGNIMHRRFCPHCGTPLFSQSEARPDLIIARAGALDDPELIAPSSAIWTASAPSWALIDEAMTTHERQAPPLGVSVT